MRCSWRSGRLYFEVVFFPSFLQNGRTRSFRTTKVVGNKGTEAEITAQKRSQMIYTLPGLEQ